MVNGLLQIKQDTDIAGFSGEILKRQAINIFF